MPLLGVNIDHIASVRQLRRGISPEPVLAALVCQAHGADSIVAHLKRRPQAHTRTGPALNQKGYSHPAQP